MMQGMWVTFCTLPIVALNSIPNSGFTTTGWLKPGLTPTILGACRCFWFWLGLWSFLRGIVIECMADWELSRWRWDRYRGKHNETFCGTGLWDRRSVLPSCNVARFL